MDINVDLVAKHVRW